MSGRNDTVALVVHGGEDLTYGEWEVRSNAVARGLSARGVGAGGRVGLLFDPPAWGDFAVAHLGLRKIGAVAVHLSPGATPRQVVRDLAHAAAVGLLCPPQLVPAGTPVWTAPPDEVGAGHDTGSLTLEVDGAAPAELLYRPAHLAPAQAWSVAGDGEPGEEGWLVHAWAPGSRGGRHALGMLLAGVGTVAATLAAFEPDDLCALVAARRAVTLGLTPALAAALLASGAPRRHDLSSVRRLVLSAPPTATLQIGLQAAFGTATTTVLDDPSPWPHATDLAPVAVSQEGMLWHEQFRPGSFNLPCLVRRYEGSLDVAALEWALSEIVRRHQPLRSMFALIDGSPRQVAGDARALRLPVVDLGALPPAARDAEASRLIAEATGRPFDLASGPLFEPRLVRLGPDDHLLVIRVHHTVFDDWSVDLFRRELSALYAAGTERAPSPLVEPALSFSDFSRRQQARIAGPSGSEERAWWRKELDGAPLSVQLPIGPAGPDGGEPVRVDLPASLAEGLRALAPRLRATPYMTVLAAFSVLLARAIGQDDLLIATVVAHRNRSDVEPLIGCFTKKVPLRLRVEGDPTFPELVARTRGSLLGSLAHQDLAFDAAVQEGVGRAAADHGVVPQLSVVFQGETPQRVKLALPGLVARPYEAVRRERHFSSGPEGVAETWGDGIYLRTFLILSLLESIDGMALVARGVFDPAVVRGLLEDFQELLADVVADPVRPISALPGGRWAPPLPSHDALVLRGFRARRSSIEGALGRCPGVADVGVAVRHVAGEQRLIAYVVPDPGAAPTLRQLRHEVWASAPGAVWPAEAVLVDVVPRLPDGRPDVGGLPLPPDGLTGRRDPDPLAELLAAMWAECRRSPVAADSGYWQDFSLLRVLTEVREAGIDLDDELVVRCRTPEMLAAALATARPDRPR